MNSFEEAISIAKLQKNWRKNPLKPKQEIALVESVEHMWDECSVKLNAVVIRKRKKGFRSYIYWVLTTTDSSLKKEQIVCFYRERPEIEEDYHQFKDEWLIEGFTSTKFIHILWFVTFTFISFSIFISFIKGNHLLSFPLRGITNLHFSSSAPLSYFPKKNP